MLKDNAVVKKLVSTGEERIGKLAQQLLANEKFVSALQSVVSTSIAAKGSVDKSVRAVLSAMSMPSIADIEQLKFKIDDLERAVSALEKRFEKTGKN